MLICILVLMLYCISMCWCCFWMVIFLCLIMVIFVMVCMLCFCVLWKLIWWCGVLCGCMWMMLWICFICCLWVMCSVCWMVICMLLNCLWVGCLKWCWLVRLFGNMWFCGLLNIWMKWCVRLVLVSWIVCFRCFVIVLCSCFGYGFEFLFIVGFWWLLLFVFEGFVVLYDLIFLFVDVWLFVW